ncbi:pilus assembly protein CpaE [Microbacterium candidum]|uniref:Pilus assembly protein CpaE n=1 Tax=Microbacterium candidum TaxID=3041922 RepID=A0ABT7MUM1_9MICO|nr:pilus assembly protein CpaE [Microbacterium sp. ASV49]MDL9978142.1 pilus assembly protein CpaE [Microbacterium sp. ASV49]
MISRELALALKAAGLRWHPESGDRFQLDLPDDVEAEVEADVFTVSEMTIESHRTPSGVTILGFNGTTEWALDAVTLDDAIWLPGEGQLRELLRGTFRSLRRLPDAFEVEVEIAGGLRRFEHPDAAEAYGMALLELIRQSR